VNSFGKLLLRSTSDDDGVEKGEQAAEPVSSAAARGVTVQRPPPPTIVLVLTDFEDDTGKPPDARIQSNLDVFRCFLLLPSGGGGPADLGRLWGARHTSQRTPTSAAELSSRGVLKTCKSREPPPSSYPLEK
jgi:hypothetical protein